MTHRWAWGAWTALCRAGSGPCGFYASRSALPLGRPRDRGPQPARRRRCCGVRPGSGCRASAAAIDDFADEQRETVGVMMTVLQDWQATLDAIQANRSRAFSITYFLVLDQKAVV